MVIGSVRAIRRPQRTDLTTGAPHRVLDKLRRWEHLLACPTRRGSSETNKEVLVVLINFSSFVISSGSWRPRAI